MHSQASPPEQAFSLPSALAQIQSALNSSSPAGASSNPALPPPSTIAEAASKIHTSLPAHGLGSAATLSHILDDLSPGFNGSKTSPHYYGFVTGGVLPVAEAADHVVTRWDQNVQAHLAHHGVATSIEWRAGGLLCDLLGLAGAADGPAWRGRAFTTGATASNVLGLACGREAVLGWKMRACGASVRARGERVLGSRRGREADVGGEGVGVGDLGLLEACRRAGVEGFQVLTTMGHSSLSKAASIVGLGRSSVKDVGMEAEPWKFDMQRLEEMLSRHGTASIVAVSCGEVNTGRYATSGLEEMRRLRELCDRFGAWLHVDGAFGLFARALPLGDEFAFLREACEGIELADSITGDAHKCLNVPYDCGFFLTPSLPLLTSVFKNPNAAYLASPTSTPTQPSELIPSPLNINIENSRRFRALPVYAVLVASGRSGLADMFARQVRLARRIAALVDEHRGYEILPVRSESGSAGASQAQTGIIVLFRAVDERVNADLAARINRSGKIMVSGTAWEGRPAVRIAVSTWMVEVERDVRVVREVLEGALL